MIATTTSKDQSGIIKLCELSPAFIPECLIEENFQEIKELLPGMLANAKLYSWREDNGSVGGFVGLTVRGLELMFLHPDCMEKELARQFTMFCVYSLNVDRVEVSKQNQSAVGLYKKMGYELIREQELDQLEKTPSILQMKYMVRA